MYRYRNRRTEHQTEKPASVEEALAFEICDSGGAQEIRESREVRGLGGAAPGAAR
ncbi:hypothetical protein YDYSY3_24550 [Paenibacillus chitinolyticus]|nr:hypothetical protein YDYSY3_24550 [Paenibacillus chitinolyticus]